jgi:ABC-type uncharacterized transport system substrate-binding protein
LLLRGLLVRQHLFEIIFTVAAVASLAPAATAHPHVWATVRSEIVFGPDHRITGIRHAWTFDEFYTAMAVQGLDTDNDGIYSREELQPLAKVNVESLKEFDYFTFLRLGKDEKKLPLKEPVDYWVDYDESLLILHFTLPLETPLDPSVEDLAVDVYDPSFFVAFGFAPDTPVKITGAPAQGCAAEIQKPDPEAEAETKALSEAFFSQLGPGSNFGAQFAQTAIVKCSTH